MTKFFMDQTSRGDKIAVSLPYHEMPLVRTIGGGRWDRDRKLWTFPLGYPVLLQLMLAFPGATLDDNLKRCVSWVEETREVLLAAKNGLVTEMSSARVERLSRLQVVGADWLTRTSGVLADEMGSGKTVMACVALDELRSQRVLIVCPDSVRRSWAEHLSEWTDIEPVIVKGSPKKRSEMLTAERAEPTAFILNWSQLALHSRLAGYGNTRLSEKDRTDKELNFVEWDVVIADEAHRAKNPKAKQTRALWAISGSYRWLLTGTPVANNPADLWSLLRYCSPEDWPSRVRYIDRYCKQEYSPWGADNIVGLLPENKAEFHFLTDPYILRRLKHEVMEKVIVKKPVVRWVQLPPKHRKQYDKFKKDLIAQIDGGFVMATNPLTATVRLVQLCAAQLEYDEADNAYTMAGPSPKVAELKVLLEELGDAPLVVYSSSKQLLYLAAKMLEESDITYAEVTGDTTDKGNPVRRFQEGECRVFLATTGAASEGITLTRAKHLCMLQRSWSMVQNLQAEDRIHRWGQESNEVEIIDIVTEDTIDERIYEIFGSKKRMLSEVTQDDLKELL